MTWPHHEYEHPGTLIPRLMLPYGPFASLLDVGGGGGIVGQGVWKVGRTDVLDIFPPKTPPPNFRLGDGLDAVSLYGEKSFDAVQCAEVIEHLAKVDGPRLLDVLERVARRVVVITTPTGFLHHDPADHPDEPWADNPYQKHLCGWMPGELTAMGYQIFLNGPTGETQHSGQIIAWKDVRS